MAKWFNRVRLYTGNKYDPCIKVPGFVRIEDDTVRVVVRHLDSETLRVIYKSAALYLVLDGPDGAKSVFGWAYPETFLYGIEGDLEMVTFHKIRPES